MANLRDNIEHKVDWQTELANSHKGISKVIVWDYRHLDRLKTFWISDVHWGAKGCDKDLFLSKLDMIGEKQMTQVIK